MEAPIIPGLPDDISRECLARVSREALPTARGVSKLWRTEVHSPSFYRLRRDRGLARDVVALAQIDRPGGLSNSISFSISLFDLLSGEWSSPPPVPGGRLPIFCQITAAGRELMVLGGWDPATWIANNEVFIYDLASGTWRRGSRIPGPRRSFFACAAAPSGRTVYVAGGHDEEKNSLRSALAYDVETDSWSPLPDMSTERDECSGIFCGGVFLVVGGYSTEMQGNFTNSCEAFNPATGRWGHVEETFVAAGVAPTAVAAGPDGRLFRSMEGRIEVREGAGTAWRKVVELPESGDGKKTTVPRLVVCSGAQNKLILIGSSRHGNIPSPTIYTLEDGPEGEDRPRWAPACAPPETITGNVQTACCLEI